MGGVPVKHHSKSKVGRRRSQLALKRMHVARCSKCGAPTLPHKTCPSCGFYGRSPKNEKSASK